MAAPEAVAPAPEGEAAAVPQITLETTVKLSGGSEIPLFGLGTWQAKVRIAMALYMYSTTTGQSSFIMAG